MVWSWTEALQLLRALDAFAEDPGSTPSTHRVAYICGVYICKFHSRASSATFRSPRSLAHQWHRRTHTGKTPKHGEYTDIGESVSPSCLHLQIPSSPFSGVLFCLGSHGVHLKHLASPNHCSWLALRFTATHPPPSSQDFS